MKKYLLLLITFLTSFIFFSNVKAETIKIGNYNATLYEGDTIKISSDDGEIIIPDLSNKYTDYVVDKGVAESGYTVYWYNYEDTKSFYVSSLLSNRIRTLEFSGSHRGYLLYWPDYNAYYGYVGIDDSETRTLVTGDRNYSYFVASSQDIYYHNSVYYAKNSEIIPDKPTINIKTIEKGYTDETKKEKIFEKIQINFSIFNTDKYLYFYSTSPEKNKTWIDITENDFKYTGYSNGTLYIAVIDKAKYVESAENGQELVFDYITTATYIFAGLAELIPDLEFSTDIPDSCYLTIGGNREVICKRLTVKAKNYNDLNKYRFEYSNDKTNFLTLYANEYVNVYNENTAVVFKLYDAKKGEYIKTITYNLTGISKNMSSVGPYVNLIGKYIEKEYYYEISAYFYNYDSSLYNYYYSTDGKNWTEIESVTLNVYSGSGSSAIRLRKFKIYESCTFYLKVEDKNDNYVAAYTFTVNLDKNVSNNLSTNKISSFLDSISEEVETISDLIKYFYNGLDSIIKDFLIAIFTLIIICSIIILARK